jgi:GDPmannose 4,6-dehydratase
MWLILQQGEPEDYVLATGAARSVREFVEIAFGHPDIDVTIEWKGKAEEEIGMDPDGNTVVAVDPQYYRPAEVNVLLGDSSKAKEKLGWQPEISFDRMVNDMVEAAL